MSERRGLAMFFFVNAALLSMFAAGYTVGHYTRPTMSVRASCTNGGIQVDSYEGQLADLMLLPDGGAYWLTPDGARKPAGAWR